MVGQDQNRNKGLKACARDAVSGVGEPTEKCYLEGMETIDLTTHFSVSAAKLYKAWLDPVHHPAMSFGSDAEIDAQVGGGHTSGDGYIWGIFEELVPGEKIVMTWRTTEFAEDQADSRVELQFADAQEGSTLRLVHTGLPDEQIETYRQGWHEFYFAPMKVYFGA